MAIGIETLIVVATALVGAATFFIKARIQDYMEGYKTTTDAKLDETIAEVKNEMKQYVNQSVLPIAQRLTEAEKDVDRLRDKTDQHSIDIKALETNVGNLIKSIEAVGQKLDRFFDIQFKK